MDPSGPESVSGTFSARNNPGEPLQFINYQWQLLGAWGTAPEQLAREEVRMETRRCYLRPPYHTSRFSRALSNCCISDEIGYPCQYGSG
jgi:hypothetical protein